MKKNSFKKYFLTVLFLAFMQYTFAFLNIVLAQEIPLEDFEEIKLLVGQAQTVAVSNPKRVVVGKPEIADVFSVTTNEVVLEPKKAGQTTLFVWDTYGQHAYRLKVLSDDLDLLKAHADSILKELNLAAVQTKINENESKLMLTGEVGDINEKERLLTALSSLKDQLLDLVIIREDQTLIQIDTQILEINRNNFKNLGLSYQTAVTLTDNADKKLNNLTDMFATSHWSRDKLDITLNMLVKEDKARILSQPKLVCLSGKEAEFLVGGEIPIISTTVTNTSTTNNVQFKQYGINLKIRPTYKGNSNIMFGLDTEVSDIDDANTFTDVDKRKFPAFLTRNAKSELYLKDGQSVIIAGLIKSKDSNAIQKFPFLGDVPILGMLWRSRDFQNKQTDLVIVLTPTIIQGTPAYERKEVSSFGASSGVLPPQQTNKKSYSQAQQPYTDSGSYIQGVKDQIFSSIEYPNLAGELGAKGTVRLRIRILSSGQLKDVYVLSSSGSELLDKSAIESVKQLSPFPAFPSAIDDSEITIDIPIVYS